MQDPNMFDIWNTLPSDMTLVMQHVFCAFMLIQILWGVTLSISTFWDEVPSASHPNSPLDHASGGKSTSSHLFPHTSLDEPLTNIPSLLILPPPLVYLCQLFHHPLTFLLVLLSLLLCMCHNLPHPLILLQLLHMHHQCRRQPIHFLLLTWAFIDSLSLVVEVLIPLALVSELPRNNTP